MKDTSTCPIDQLTGLTFTELHFFVRKSFENHINAHFFFEISSTLFCYQLYGAFHEAGYTAILNTAINVIKKWGDSGPRG